MPFFHSPFLADLPPGSPKGATGKSVGGHAGGMPIPPTVTVHPVNSEQGAAVVVNLVLSALPQAVTIAVFIGGHDGVTRGEDEDGGGFVTGL